MWSKFVQLVSDHFNEIITLSGTLLGVILGWVLGKLDRKGKLKVFVSSWELNSYGRKTKEETTRLGYVLILDLYNSSADAMIMRDIMIGLYKDKKLVLCHTPNDDVTNPTGNGSIYHKAKPINVQPKSVLRHKLFYDIGENINQLWECNFVRLSYINKNGHKKKVFIAKFDADEYFTQLKKREDEIKEYLSQKKKLENDSRAQQP